MKLVRYGAAGREKPGIIAEDGKIRDLSRLVKDIDGAMLASGGRSPASRGSGPASAMSATSSPSA
jgi:hypothetical protein